MAERFAFVKGEEINPLANLAVPENTRKLSSCAVNVFGGIFFIWTYVQIHKLIARFAWFQLSDSRCSTVFDSRKPERMKGTAF